MFNILNHDAPWGQGEEILLTGIVIFLEVYKASDAFEVASEVKHEVWKKHVLCSHSLACPTAQQQQPTQ